MSNRSLDHGTVSDVRTVAPPAQRTRRVVAAGVIGTVIEYFDFLIYATVSSLVFGALFFPGKDDFVATLLVWSTFAVGYLARPLGGIIFGHYGDKLGRSRILFITMVMMGLSTVVIGLLPTYDQIGVAAPIILITMRVVQGIGVGGEFGGATTMIIEHAHDTGRRGLFGAVMSASSMAGFILASGLMAVLTAVTSEQQFIDWAWRVPFLVSVVLVGIGFYVRYRLEETPIMREAIRREEVVRLPIVEIFRAHTKQALLAIAAPFGVFAAYYVIVVFSISYVIANTDVSESFVLAMSTVSQVLYFGFIVFAGWLSDRVGRRLPIMIGAVGLGLWSFAFFPLLLAGTAVSILVAFVVALVFLGLINGPQAAFLAEMFGTEVRFSGLSVGWQVSAAVAGGLSPVVATALIHHFGSWTPVAVLLVVTLAITFVAVLLSDDNTDVDLTA